MSLSPGEFRDLIRAALPESYDADTQPPDAQRLFTPDTHRRALEPDVTIVRGGRGVGKTVWFGSLQQDQLRRLAASAYRIERLASGVRVAPGFGARLDRSSYPTPSRLHSLLASGVSAYEIWAAVALNAFESPWMVGLDTWDQKTNAIRSEPERLDEEIADLDETAASQGLTLILLFDALDRMSTSADTTSQLVEGVFRLALDLRTRTKNIRAKVFVRPDLLDQPFKFTDASKLTSNAVSLTWTQANLYGLLFTLMGNAGGAAATRFRDESANDWQEIESGIWRSESLAGDAALQQRLFTEIAGPFMGANHRRGRTYPWLPNHLSDGNGEVSPRSFLQAIKAAVDDTADTRAAYALPIHYESIKAGVQQASETRVVEISEDIPWVRTVVRPLSGMQVPMTEKAALERWTHSGVRDALTTSAEEDEAVRVGPRAGDDLDELVNELIELGVMIRRADGRLDLPDVYRVAFGLGRKGGVAPHLGSRSVRSGN